MLWVWLALGSALSFSLADVFAKRALRFMDPIAVGWVKFAGAAVLTLPLLFVGPYPSAWPFVGFLLLALPAEALAMYTYHRAIASSPLSLTVPMLAFTPVFLLLAGWVMLGEKPTAGGAAGILLVTAGAYVLHLRPGVGLLTPFTAIFTQQGTRLMLVVAALYAVTASVGKVLAQLSNPLFFGAFYTLTLAGLLGPTALPRVSQTRRSLPWLVLPAVAFFYGAMILFHFTAVVQAPVAYMIAVKRTSLLFAVLWGRLFFREEALGWRLLGAGLMLAGVATLATMA